MKKVFETNGVEIKEGDYVVARMDGDPIIKGIVDDKNMVDSHDLLKLKDCGYTLTIENGMKLECKPEVECKPYLTLEGLGFKEGDYVQINYDDSTPSSVREVTRKLHQNELGLKDVNDELLEQYLSKSYYSISPDARPPTPLMHDLSHFGFRDGDFALIQHKNDTPYVRQVEGKHDDLKLANCDDNHLSNILSSTNYTIKKVTVEFNPTPTPEPINIHDGILYFCPLNKIYGYVVGRDLDDGAAGYLEGFDGEDVTGKFYQIEFSSLKPVNSVPPTPTPAFTTSDAVHHPKHYELMEGVESLDIIACSLTLDEWRGFCLGNAIKYRLRAGKKDGLQQDIDKAENYADTLFGKHKHLCRTVARG